MRPAVGDTWAGIPWFLLVRLVGMAAALALTFLLVVLGFALGMLLLCCCCVLWQLAALLS